MGENDTSLFLSSYKPEAIKEMQNNRVAVCVCVVSSPVFLTAVQAGYSAQASAQRVSELLPMGCLPIWLSVPKVVTNSQVSIPDEDTLLPFCALSLFLEPLPLHMGDPCSVRSKCLVTGAGPGSTGPAV